MYIEFSDRNIKEIGKLLVNPDWIQCPRCEYVWQENNISGMIECNKCNLIMHNPLYKGL